MRKIMNIRYVEFKRADVTPCDFFEDVGLFAYYGAHDELRALEFARPACVILGDADLLSISFRSARALLSSIASDFKDDASGGESREAGIGLWAPELPEDDTAPCESVISFVKGYYG
jgi:hypothetical protein